jgi:hypothetical protein
VIKIKVGDRVKIKDRPEWPSPPGFKLAGSEGRVIQIGDSEEFINGLVEGFLTVQLDKPTAYFEIGTQLTLQVEAVEKL